MAAGPSYLNGIDHPSIEYIVRRALTSPRTSSMDSPHYQPVKYKHIDRPGILLHASSFTIDQGIGRPRQEILKDVMIPIDEYPFLDEASEFDHWKARSHLGFVINLNTAYDIARLQYIVHCNFFGVFNYMRYRTFGDYEKEYDQYIVLEKMQRGLT